MKTKFTVRLKELQVFCNYTLHLAGTGHVGKEQASEMGRIILSAAVKLQVKCTTL